MNKLAFEKAMDQMINTSLQGINQITAIKQRELAEKDLIIKELQEKLKNCQCKKEEVPYA